MITKAILRAAVLLSVLFTAVTASAEWSRWMGTNRPGVVMRDQQDSACGNRGKYYWYQLKNTSVGRMTFVSVMTYTDGDGRPAKEENNESLDPGRESQKGYICAIVGSARLTIQDEPSRRTPSSTSSSSGSSAAAKSEGTYQPLFGSRIQRPAVHNVQLDEECLKLLRVQSARLEAAGAAKSLLAWSPLIKLAGETNPVHAAFSIATGDWEEIARSFRSVDKIVFSNLATEARIHAGSHIIGNRAAKDFWEAIADFYGSQIR